MSSVYLQLEDPGAPPFAAKVVEILNSAFDPTNSISVEEAAVALDSLFTSDYEEHGTAGSFLWWFWDLMHDLARQIPYDQREQDQLAAVIKALTCLPPKTVSLGEDWGGAGENSVDLWQNLPMFANTLNETLSDGDPRAHSEDTRKDRQVNLQAYAARVAGLGLVSLETNAVWALVDALEGTVTPVRGAPDEVNSDPAAVEYITHKTRIAAAWMAHAGHLLHGRDEVVSGATAGPLWKLDKMEAMKLRRKVKGTDGLCPERWQLWKERFGVLRDAVGLDEKARKDAGDAYLEMEKIEKRQ
ncbi:hypothetical protein BDP55DRAFT_649399 [Colletotrichum godetiae]|uniref:Uncharacterized protein n=1 Tax=Colletotrichum godetiae TaxID=1209918 RepID=A0AAJ0AVA1_9PEZI|nr:uncharacterized protein BDP55DRAFT_649399 [Colletotrichum godetiae]KAK1691027.1 hypothetical protein BDP55DRAFT_649399 [Colletotrichum godetiae]